MSIGLLKFQLQISVWWERLIQHWLLRVLCVFFLSFSYPPKKKPPPKGSFHPQPWLTSQAYLPEGRADLRHAIVRLAVVQSFNLPIAAWSWKNSWEQILPHSLTEPVAEKQSGCYHNRQEALSNNCQACLKLAKCRWPLCSQTLLAAVRGGPPGEYPRASKLWLLIFL